MAWADFVTQFSRVDFCQAAKGDAGHSNEVVKARLEDCVSDAERRAYYLSGLEALNNPTAPSAGQSTHAYRITGKITAACGATEREWNR